MSFLAANRAEIDLSFRIVKGLGSAQGRLREPPLRTLYPLPTVRRAHATRECSAWPARLFAGVGLDLLEGLQELIGLANVNDREVRHHTCDEQQARNNPLHRSLLYWHKVVRVLIHKGSENSIPKLRLSDFLSVAGSQWLQSGVRANRVTSLWLACGFPKAHREGCLRGPQPAHQELVLMVAARTDDIPYGNSTLRMNAPLKAGVVGRVD